MPGQLELLASLAERVLSISRELGLHGDAEEGLVQLTATEVHAMRYIHLNPGTSATRVAEGVGLQRSNFSTALRSLKDKGMVDAVPDSRDARSTRLYPTEFAIRNYAERLNHWAAFLGAALGEGIDVRPCLETLARIDSALGAERQHAKPRGTDSD